MSGLERRLLLELSPSGEGGRNPAEPDATERDSEEGEEESFGPVSRGRALHGHHGRERPDRGKREQEKDEAANTEIDVLTRRSLGGHGRLLSQVSCDSIGVSARPPHSAQAPS